MIPPLLLLSAFVLQGTAIPKPVIAPHRGQGDSVVAFVDVNVIPMTRDGILQHQTVIVRGGRIAEMGPAAHVKAPAGAITVNGRGKYLMPALAEMHGHLPSPNAAPELTENVLFLYVANGVTTVRGMQGNLEHLELKARVARGELLGPRLWVPGPPLSGNSAPTPEAGRRLVEEQHAAGFDHLKIHEGLSRETYDTIVATAKRLGMRFAGHVPDAVGVYHALESGQASIDHLDNYVETVSGGGPDSADDRRIAQVVAATCAAQVWTVRAGRASWSTAAGCPKRTSAPAWNASRRPTGSVFRRPAPRGTFSIAPARRRPWRRRSGRSTTTTSRRRTSPEKARGCSAPCGMRA